MSYVACGSYNTQVCQKESLDFVHWLLKLQSYEKVLLSFGNSHDTIMRHVHNSMMEVSWRGFLSPEENMSKGISTWNRKG